MAIIVGISGFYHNSAAALFVDGELVAAAEEERFTRVKFDPLFPKNAICHILSTNNLTPCDVDIVAYYELPLEKLKRHMSDSSFNKGLDPDVFKKACLPEHSIKKFFGQETQIQYFPHHLSHASLGIYSSGFSRCAIMVFDAVGETTCSLSGVYEDGKVEVLGEEKFPHSLGLFYSSFSSFCGFRVNSDEYKFMGLAAYGRPRFYELIKKRFFKQLSDESFGFNMDLFDFSTGSKCLFIKESWESILGVEARSKTGSILSCHEDIAASVQKLIEDILITRAQLLQKRSKANKLVFSGGVALNCLANMKIYEHAGFEEVFVPFGAGDSGSAIGCAALAQLSLDKKKIDLGSPYLGPSYQGDKLPFSKLWKKVSEQEVATLLSQDCIIGLFQGRSEFGPRALGNRSFLASPGKAEMKDILNKKVKGRESFRPFSPVVMDSIVSELTSYKYVSKYMTMTVPILEKAQKLIPAAIHKDGTARVQVVSHEDNSFLYGILEAFYKTTKIPALLNTSFNLSDEPIVENIEDAFMCFLRSNADYLLIDGMILDRSLVPENIVKNAKQFYRKRSSSISESVYTF